MAELASKATPVDHVRGFDSRLILTEGSTGDSLCQAAVELIENSEIAIIFPRYFTVLCIRFVVTQMCSVLSPLVNKKGFYWRKISKVHCSPRRVLTLYSCMYNLCAARGDKYDTFE